MALRDEEKHKARILAIAHQVEQDLNLDWLEITYKFNTRTDGDRATAEALPQWQYRIATITFNLVFAATESDEEIRHSIIHEMVHVLIAPLWDSLPELKPPAHFDALNEFATESVTRAISAALAVVP